MNKREDFAAAVKAEQERIEYSPWSKDANERYLRAVTEIDSIRTAEIPEDWPKGFQAVIFGYKQSLPIFDALLARIDHLEEFILMAAKELEPPNTAQLDTPATPGDGAALDLESGHGTLNQAPASN